MSEIVEAVLLGFAAGVLSGMFGVGGGILFVPTLGIVLGLTQLAAQATSLAAMIPVVVLGAWLQSRHGNVAWRAAAVLGITSGAGVVAGAAIARSLPEDTLRTLFAVLLLGVALQLAWSVRKSHGRSAGGS